MSSPMPPDRPLPSPSPPPARWPAVLWALALMAGLTVVLWLVWQPLLKALAQIQALAADQEAFKGTIDSYGAWAPAAWVALQVFQTVISPIPGEVVTTIGGYIFGWLPSLIYSFIGLTLGSWFNFALARLLGSGVVKRLVPPKYLERFRRLMARQGVLVSLAFFLFPGLPKDYLCYFLGISPMNWRVFLILSSLGRVPLTLLHSVQGDLLAHQKYWSFAVLTGAALLLLGSIFFWRNSILAWLGRLEADRRN